MARLAAMEKGEFYPTPSKYAKIIANAINLDDLNVGRRGVLRIVDPSCGEGEILHLFASELKERYPDVPIETWGVEISEQRAERAREFIDTVITAPVEVCDNRPTNVPVASIVFGNPPYDVEEAASTSRYRNRTVRYEYLHLKRITPWIADDGILIWHIPYRALDQDMARHLASWFYDIEVYRYDDDPSDGYNVFGQLIILAQKRSEENSHRDYDFERDLYQNHGIYYSTADQKATVKRNTRVIGELEPTYTTRTVRQSAIIKRLSYTIPEQVEAALDQPAMWSQFVKTSMVENMGIGRPPLSPTLGHVAQLVASGFAGTMYVDGELFKGRAIKDVRETPDPDHHDRTLIRDYWSTHIVHITEEGLRHMYEPGEVATFLKAHADIFADYVKRNFPAYAEDMTEEEEAHLNTLALGRMIPGAEKPGLTSSQKKWIIGIARSLKKHGVGHLIGEMGVGKTISSVAVVDLKDLYPAVVTCPPHLVEKWKSEVAWAIPGAKAVIVENLSELLDVKRKYETGKLPHKLIVVLSRSYMKLGPGWNAAALEVPQVVRRQQPDYHIATQVEASNIDWLKDRIVVWNNHKYDLEQGMYVQDELDPAQWACSDEHAFRAYQRIKALRSQFYTSTAWKQVDRWEYQRHDGEKRMDTWATLNRMVCPDCGAPYTDHHNMSDAEFKEKSEKRPFRCLAPKRLWINDEVGWSIHKEGRAFNGENMCLAPAWQMAGTRQSNYREWTRPIDEWRKQLVEEGQKWAKENPLILGPVSDKNPRWALATYIKNYMKGWFKTYIPDEVHQYKAKGSDQGMAFALLCSSVDNVISLTGTWFGGYSTSIFYLLYRTQQNIRRVFGYNDAMQWAQQYGVLQRTYKEKENSWSSYTAKAKKLVGTKEMPGLAPGALAFFLSNTVFARLKDLGIALPSYREEVVYYDLSELEMEDYQKCWSFTWSKLIEFMPKFTSSWLQWNLARPNSMFRDEVVKCKYDSTELEMPSVLYDEDGNLHDPAKPLLTKEKALVAHVQSEIAAGRNVVIYLRQTGTRDIRDRLVQVLKMNGIDDVTVLDSGVQPKLREAWLKKNERKVLITNPKLVETGLDLVSYATAIFYEIEYSLYTLWQSQRRIWRPGQLHNVKVIYMVAKGTLEGEAIRLISKKLQAGKLVHGDDVTSAIVPDEGGISLVEELLKVMRQKAGDSPTVAPTLDVDEVEEKVFGDTPGDLVSKSITGSAIVPTDDIAAMDWDQFLAEHSEKLSKPRRSTKRIDAPIEQIKLF